jgi:hypothetical protein
MPLVSSDGVDNALIYTSSGLFAFDITTKITRLLNTSKAIGLAYDGQNFLELQDDGILYSVSLVDGSLHEIGTGYTNLYDTIDGYLVTVDGVTSVIGNSGTTAPANGNYTYVHFTIN